MSNPTAETEVAETPEQAKATMGLSCNLPDGSEVLGFIEPGPRDRLPMTLFEAIRESNRIEGILRDPTQQEINEHRRFLELERVTVPELCAFVKVYQPNAVLRDRPGLDARVGNHIPPAGGAAVPLMLDAILEAANADKYTPWNVHLEYETLHPFTDGNGRSGRMLWYWMMVGNRQAELGFLHAFYYQTLRYAKR